MSPERLTDDVNSEDVDGLSEVEHPPRVSLIAGHRARAGVIVHHESVS